MQSIPIIEKHSHAHERKKKRTRPRYLSAAGPPTSTLELVSTRSVPVSSPVPVPASSELPLPPRSGTPNERAACPNIPSRAQA
ncbi:hypothetical protein K505DRAFT_6947 [Melanomma pulvis-pyrius CBS 109.77]|uniref:Uncharacterized protein n=1 Tax=Melanomma pulvis-pyrius CBS 109.77 TaxID=1314802 RepID=A0A6A6WNR1_9PLEO|nr:hypothetical protein K505DRAFT_6947 [Melanomma pulvis-pyrius CBS 109.77]